MKREKAREIEQELAHEDEQMLKEMSYSERQKHLREQAEAEAFRESSGFYD